MDFSILIARIASIIYLAAALGGFFNKGYFRRMSVDIYRNAVLIYFMGFITVIIGFLIVSYHNIWAIDWRLLITLIGWLALMKGIFLIVFPGLMQGLSERFFRDRVIIIYPYVTLFFGLLFGYFGFVQG